MLVLSRLTRLRIVKSGCRAPDGSLHAAVALTPDRACGLATLGMFEGRGDPLAPLLGRMSMPVGPGLGDGLVDWYRDE